MPQPHVETKIWLALKAHVETIPLTLVKAWPGQKFTPPAGTNTLPPYLRIGRVTVDPVRQFLDFGKPHERTGALMVTLVYPLGPDIAVFDNIAGTIAAHFADGTQMRYADVCVLVPNYPYVNEGYEDNGYWTVPISIPWRCYA